VHWFDKKQGDSPALNVSGVTGPKVPRHSGAWAALRKRLQAEPGLRVIDTGYTSPSNINYLTGLGHSIFRTIWSTTPARAIGRRVWISRAIPSGISRDSSAVPQLFGAQIRCGAAVDRSGLSAGTFRRSSGCAPVFSHEPGRPGAGPLPHQGPGRRDNPVPLPCHAGDDVEMQLTQQFPIQRAFTNRSIERLFAGWSGHRQFLAKDSVSEVIMTR